MAELPPPNPPPVPLPAQPQDPAVQLPIAPASPPTEQDVIRAVLYHHDVYTSFRRIHLGERCTLNDRFNSILYKHSVITQAAAATYPQAMAPPWFQGVIQQLENNLRNEIQQTHNNIINQIQHSHNNIINQIQHSHNEILRIVLPSLKQLVNLSKEGVGPLEVVPFVNGEDPTHPPHNLPPLNSVDAIEHLDGPQIVAYLTGYAIDPLPGGPHPHAINRSRKETLKRVVGAPLFELID